MKDGNTMITHTAPSGKTETQRTTTRTVTAQNVRTLERGAGEGPSKAAVPAAIIPGLGNVVSTSVDVGSSPTQALIVTIAGLSLTTDMPAAVICQPRQNLNEDLGLQDTFGVQVITTAADHIVVLITRLDSASGWDQDLRLDFVIFDQANNS